MDNSKTKPTVDAFFSKAKKWQQELSALRTIVLGCGLVEELKWYQPVYTFQGSNLLIISSFKEHCVLSFFKGVLLKDSKKILDKPGENTQSARIIKFTTLEQIKEKETIIKSYINEAIAAEKAGLKVNFKKITEHTIPAELQKKLDNNPEFSAAFKALTPGRQRAYLLHFSAPKQAATRESRIENCTEKILNGIGINDDYKLKKKLK